MQLLRFYESTDMKNWTYLYTSQPDPTWYKSLGDPGNRWDAMYMIPKEEGDPSAGYWGYGVGWSKPGVVQGPMMMQSTDGRNWEVLSPPKMDWGDVPPSLMEYSGCERIGGKYYLIGGQFIGSNLGIDRSAGYGIWTAISDHPRGPFRPDKNAYRLCGIQKRDEENMVWLAAWVRGKDNELLVSNSVSIQRRTWMLPLRKAVVDSEGHLRLHWWPGNVALCGEEVPLKTDHVFLQAAEPEKEFNLFELPEELDVQQGFVFEGMFTVKAPIVSGTKNRRTAIGLFMPETETQSKAIELEVGPPDGRESVIGLLKSLPDGEFQLHAQDITRDGFHATMTGVEPGEHHFRLLVRIGCFELYIDDKLMQTYFFEPGVKSVGVFTRNLEAEFKNLRIWKMSLPRSPFPFSPDSESK